jgi:hypothetical protein
MRRRQVRRAAHGKPSGRRECADFNFNLNATETLNFQDSSANSFHGRLSNLG